MSFKTTQWVPDLPLPLNADRKTLAVIISHHYFPISPRTLEKWPLTVRRPNRAAVYNVQEAMELAKAKFESAIVYKQAEDFS